jgi:hypothetical protein
VSVVYRFRRVVVLLALSVCGVASVCHAQGVLQRGYDSNVSGANLNETVLNTSNVKPATFGFLFEMPVDDNVYAQPLYAPGLTINDTTQNVVFVATMSDTLYAFAAPVAADPLWSINLATAVGATPVPMAQFALSGNRNIVGNLGILSTPVIDSSTKLMYVVAATLEGGTIVYRLHAINITDGTEPLGAGVVISGSYGGFTFDARYVWQRISLVLAGGQVVFGFGALESEYAKGYTGWMMSYDKSTLKRTGIFATVPSGENGGGVWQSGRPPVVDASGHVYVFTGNGYKNGYNGVNDFSESLLKLDPSTALHLLDWFTPANWRTLDAGDLDLTSSGPMLIPGTTSPPLITGGGKNGTLYILNASNLGKYVAHDTQVVQKKHVSLGEIRGGPVFWNRPASAGGPLMYLWGANDVLKAWAFKGTKIGTNPQSQGPVGPQIWPGGILTLSANGSTAGTGILWATVATSGNAGDDPPVPGALYAFDAADVSTQLWNSNMNASRDALGNFAKFVPPLAIGGRVYVATQSNKVMVYGLLP